MALRHNHTLQAARTTIQQNQAAEITANLRPNPTFFTDWEYLPFSQPSGESVAQYLQGSTEGDMGLSYLIERGNKRGAPPAGGQGCNRGDALAGGRYRARYGVPGGRSFRQCPACRVDSRTRANGSGKLSGNGRDRRSPVSRTAA